MTAKSLYVMKSEIGLVKLGIAQDPEKRKRSIQNASGMRLVLSHQTGPHDEARCIETVAHKLLGEKRRAGEWFDVSEDQAISAIRQAIEIVESGIYPAQLKMQGRNFVMRVDQEFLDVLDELRHAERPKRTRSGMVKKLVFEADRKQRAKK